MLMKLLMKPTKWAVGKAEEERGCMQVKKLSEQATRLKIAETLQEKLKKAKRLKGDDVEECGRIYKWYAKNCRRRQKKCVEYVGETGTSGQSGEVTWRQKRWSGRRNSYIR